MDSETKHCESCGVSYVIEPDDFSFYKKIEVPAPRWCPECRMRRRMTFRNERNLFKRTCESCGKEVITMYHPDAPVVVYCNDCWWSDKWDPTEYGRDYDFSKSFFVQFGELLKEVPKMALETLQNKNSPYSNYTWFSKNVYLSPSTLYSENVLYSHGMTRCHDIVDSTYLYNSGLCYESEDCQGCNNCIYVFNSKECMDSAFLYDCSGCNHCFMSANLRNKSYVFRGEEVGKEEYEKRMGEMDLGNHEAFSACVEEYEKVREGAIHRYANLFKSVRATGNNVINAKNVKKVFTGVDLENVSYGIRIIDAKDSADLYGVGDGAELLYDGVNVGHKDSLIRFSTNTFNGVRDATYSDYCRESQYIFGCAGLRKKKFHILNKAYSEGEYREMVKRIESHMNEEAYKDPLGRMYPFGEFFPPELSPFAYNESIAQEYFPTDKGEAEKSGYLWRDAEEREYKVTVHAKDLPLSIQDVDDSITKENIGCMHDGTCGEGCTKAFRILESELQFYKRMNVPLPRLCPNCRHYRRKEYRNPLNTKLWKRKCMHEGCENEFETPYSPERSEKVYCEECYQKEII